MSSIVLELQQAATNDGSAPDELLRKCVVIASKLKVESLSQWAKKELNGYAPQDDLPDYRVVPGHVKAFNPYNGQWLPVLFPEPPPETLKRRRVRQSVAELKALVHKDAGILTMVLPEIVTAALMESAETPTPPVFVISKISIIGILDTVRNLVLDWSLRLEADGILGEGMTFTKEEKERATAKTYNLQNNTGSLSIGDSYSAVQAGSVGPQSHAHDMTLEQVNAGELGDMNMKALSAELSRLRDSMRASATKVEQDIAVGHVAAAEKAAKEGDKPTVLRHLKNVGKWTLDTATKIGVNLASEAIKKASGL